LEKNEIENFIYTITQANFNEKERNKERDKPYTALLHEFKIKCGGITPSRMDKNNAPGCLRAPCQNEKAFVNIAVQRYIIK
jgi:hypothetical protein